MVRGPARSFDVAAAEPVDDGTPIAEVHRSLRIGAKLPSMRRRCLLEVGVGETPKLPRRPGNVHTNLAAFRKWTGILDNVVDGVPPQLSR